MMKFKLMRGSSKHIAFLLALFTLILTEIFSTHGVVVQLLG